MGGECMARKLRSSAPGRSGAALDVTDPEPTPAGSAFYELPNVQLSSHLAGAHGDEVVRMADTMIEEFRRWQEGEPLRYAVSLDMLDRMA